MRFLDLIRSEKAWEYYSHWQLSDINTGFELYVLIEAICGGVESLSAIEHPLKFENNNNDVVLTSALVASELWVDFFSKLQRCRNAVDDIAGVSWSNCTVHASGCQNAVNFVNCCDNYCFEKVIANYMNFNFAPKKPWINYTMKTE